MQISSNYKNTSIFLAALIFTLLSACDFGQNASPEEHIEKAKSFIAENKPNEATIELKNALQIESNLPEARWLLGKIYLQTGNGAAAFKEMSQAQSLGFNDPELSTLILQAMLLQGKNQEILDQTFTEDEMNLETLQLRGAAYLGLREFEKAEDIFNEILEKDNESVDARIGLIKIAILEKSFDKAGTLIEEALTFALEDDEVWVLKGQLAFLQNSPEEAEKAFAKAVLYQPANGAGQFGLARALLAQGKTKEALVPIEAIEARAPNHPQAKYYRGYIALLNKDTDTAKLLLQEVVSVLPEHPESLLLLSRINYDEGQLTQAETYISTFLANYPQHLPAIKLLSVIQLKLKQPDASVETLSDAASKIKGDWQVLALLGSALMESGDLEKGMSLLEEATQINPDTAAIHTQLAIGHLATGALESAVTELKSAIELDPKMVRADILLILAHLKANEFDAAVATAKVFTEKHPENPLSYNLLGAAYLSKDDVATAKQQFEKALSLKPDFTPAISNLARIDIRNKDLTAAKTKFNQILTIDENNSDALESLAQIASEQGNSEQIPALLEKARSGNPSALRPRLLLGRYYFSTQNSNKLLEVATEAQALSPRHPEVLMLLGQAHRVNGDNKQSIEALNSLLELAPDSIDVIFQLSLSQAQSGDVASAKDNLNRVLAKDKNHLGALIASVRLAMSEQDYAEAQKYVNRIKETKENVAEALVLEGDLQMVQQKPSKAIKHYEEAFKQVQNSNIVIKLADAYKSSGEKEKAISKLNDWLKEHPDDANTSLYLGSLFQQSSDDKNAIKNYEKALKQNPNNVIALNNLAWLYLDSDAAKALDFARKANRLAPDSPAVMDTLGWILMKNKKNEEGLSYLQPARKISPIPEIRYHFAAGLMAVGDKQRALIEVTELLEEFKDFPEREDAEALLRKLQ